MTSVKTDQTAHMHRLIGVFAGLKFYCRFCQALPVKYFSYLPDALVKQARSEIYTTEAVLGRTSSSDKGNLTISNQSHPPCHF